MKVTDSMKGKLNENVDRERSHFKETGKRWGRNRSTGSGDGCENIQQQIFEIEDVCLGIQEAEDMRSYSKEDFGYWENFAIKEASTKEERRKDTQ